MRTTFVTCLTATVPTESKNSQLQNPRAPPRFQNPPPKCNSAEKAAVVPHPDAMGYVKAPGQHPPDAKLEPFIHWTSLRRREKSNSVLVQLRAVKVVASPPMHRAIVVERWRVKCRFWWQGPCDNANALASCLPHMYMSRRCHWQRSSSSLSLHSARFPPPQLLPELHLEV